jgi:hypothetical protein
MTGTTRVQLVGTIPRRHPTTVRTIRESAWGAAVQDEDAAPDQGAEPEDEAAVPSAYQSNRPRNPCGDKPPPEGESRPPAHLPKVSVNVLVEPPVGIEPTT